MATPLDDVQPISAAPAYSRSEDRAYTTGDCPACGAHQFIVVAYATGRERAWLRCMMCELALAVNDGVTSPAQKPLRVPSGLPVVEREVWGEIRECLGVGPYAAAVMLCRKLFMRVAVTHGLPAKDDKDFAPTFKQCANHLLDKGIIPGRMKPWIDRIKDVGNEANHRIAPIGEESAMDVATFTQKLLALAYEMDDTMTKSEPAH